MEALLSLIFSNIVKVLNYLNINVRLQNKIFTVASLIPTLYILRIVNGYWSNGNKLFAVMYFTIFIVLMYFIILNFIYYFKNKKVRWDVTNLVENIVPEDVTFEGEKGVITNKKGELLGKEIVLLENEDASILIESVLTELVNTNEVKINTDGKDGYIVPKYTLIPYYKVKKGHLYIGSSYTNMRDLGKLNLIDGVDNLVPLGVFVYGGEYISDGIKYKEPYRVTFRIKDNN